MSTYRFVVVATVSVWFAGVAPNHARRDPLPFTRADADPDACGLLTETDVNTALEVKSLPGTHTVQSSTKICSWSDVAGNNTDHRRVIVSLTSAATFNALKSRAGIMTIEPVSGIGDDAFYAIPKSSESPFLYARKGNAAFSVRILNGLKLKAFTRDQEKTKEAALAKAAAGRL
jgi:hypothetical protein